jgi:sulfur transfer protein SufE
MTCKTLEILKQAKISKNNNFSRFFAIQHKYRYFFSMTCKTLEIPKQAKISKNNNFSRFFTIQHKYRYFFSMTCKTLEIPKQAKISKNNKVKGLACIYKYTILGTHQIPLNLHFVNSLTKLNEKNFLNKTK